MTRNYATPAAFKQAVEHRLREKAAGDGVELARLRQRLIFDRFCARVVNVFKDRVILKGGFALELRLEKARTTKDIDVRVVGNVVFADGEELRAAIERTFEYRGTHPIPSATPQAPAAWASVYKRMARSDGLSWSTLDEVTKVVQIFLDPVLSGVSGRWIPDAWAWDSDPPGPTPE